MSRSPALLTAQRAVAIVTLALIATQFFLAGAGAFGATGYDAHKTVGSILVLVILVGLVVAVVARRHPIHAAIVLGVAVCRSPSARSARTRPGSARCTASTRSS